MSARGYTWKSIAEQVHGVYLEVREDFKIGKKPEDADRYIQQIVEQAPQKDEGDWMRLLYNLFD